MVHRGRTTITKGSGTTTPTSVHLQLPNNNNNNNTVLKETTHLIIPPSNHQINQLTNHRVTTMGSTPNATSVASTTPLGHVRSSARNARNWAILPKIAELPYLPLPHHQRTPKRDATNVANLGISREIALGFGAMVGTTTLTTTTTPTTTTTKPKLS